MVGIIASRLTERCYRPTVVLTGANGVLTGSAGSVDGFNLFAAISAIAFTTVLGTVSGLILASAGAVTHDLISSVSGRKMSDTEKVRVAKLSSVVVGAIAIVLGILFQKMNPTFLVGWAFSVAASANLPER